MIYLLIFSSIVLLMVAFALEKDLFSPSCLICISYSISSFLLLYKRSEWGFELKLNTVLTVISGMIIFVVIHYLSGVVFTKKRGMNDDSTYSEDYINIKNNNYVVLIIIEAVISVLYVVLLFRAVGGMNSFSNISEMVHYYRLNTAYGDELDDKIPNIVHYLKKYNCALSYISMYILIHNYVLGKYKGQKKKIEKKYILSILLYLPLAFLSGSRFDFVVFGISFVILYIIFEKKYSQTNKIKFNTLIRVIFFLSLIVIVFSKSRTIVGRINNSSFMDYITLYYGAPIINLNEYMNVLPKDSYSVYRKRII